jgi:hypothetical protein
MIAQELGHVNVPKALSSTTRHIGLSGEVGFDYLAEERRRLFGSLTCML